MADNYITVQKGDYLQTAPGRDPEHDLARRAYTEANLPANSPRDRARQIEDLRQRIAQMNGVPLKPESDPGVGSHGREHLIVGMKLDVPPLKELQNK